MALLGGGLLAAAAVIAAASRHKKSATGALQLAGSRGLVERTLEPEGAVLIQGELWRARSHKGATVERGRKVRVVGASGHLLEVEAIE